MVRLNWERSYVALLKKDRHKANSPMNEANSTTKRTLTMFTSTKSVSFFMRFWALSSWVFSKWRVLLIGISNICWYFHNVRYIHNKHNKKHMNMNITSCCIWNRHGKNYSSINGMSKMTNTYPVIKISHDLDSVAQDVFSYCHYYVDKGPISIIRCCLTSKEIPIIKISLWWESHAWNVVFILKQSTACHRNVKMAF